MPIYKKKISATLRGKLSSVRPQNAGICKDMSSLIARHALQRASARWSETTRMSNLVEARESKLALIARSVKREWLGRGRSANLHLEAKEVEAISVLSGMILTKAVVLGQLAKRTSLPLLSITEALDIIDYFNRERDSGPWKSWYYGGQLGLAKPAQLGSWRLRRMDCLLSKRLQALAGGMDTTGNTR